MFNIGEKLIGKHNNGLQIANEFAMFEVTKVYEESNTIDIKLIAKKNGVAWKSCKAIEYFMIAVDKFEKAPDAAVLEAFPPKVSKAKCTGTYNLGSGFKITTREDGSIESNLNVMKQVTREIDTERINALNELIKDFESQGKDFRLLKEITNSKYASINNIFDKNAMKDAFSKLIKFFSEFQYAPSLRFVNTLMYKCMVNQNEGIEYIKNYFNLNTSPYKDSIVEKMKSAEFKQILGQLSIIEPGHHINQRVKVYYGAPGAGKTTKALEETDGRVIVCHKGMLPGDIMEDFSFTDGKPGFHKSIACKCMEEGLPIVFDEINNLTGEALNFMQGLLDNKDSFDYKGETIHIKPGFKVIGTMNLIRNGSAFGLSEAIVDRCEDIKEFVLTADDLMAALE